jgi:hypothetical protein
MSFLAPIKIGVALSRDPDCHCADTQKTPACVTGVFKVVLSRVAL